MTDKRFTNIEHDYENAWIKCNDNGDFMMYAIYKELDESLPSLEDLLNGLSEENEQLRKENEQLKLQMLNMEEDRDYFKSKASSLEEGYIKLQDHEIRLKKEVKSLLKSIQNNECLKNVECFKVFNTILDLIE